MLEDAKNGQFDVIVSEGLDRISRDMEHISAFYKRMQYQGITIVTISEGEISELQVGVKGAMSSLFLKDLGQKVRRGLEGRVRKGKSAGGIAYGYDVVRNLLADGSLTTSERVINQDQALIVNRIFRDYSHGLSPRTIAANLNNENIPGPKSVWGASTIYGSHQRCIGILNNVLYVGSLVWNRQRFIKDPDTGKRQARMNPPSEWITEDVPELRIIDQDLWAAVKERQLETRSSAISNGIRKVGRTKRPKHLFSGMLKCGCCGGGVIQVGKQYYGCSSSRNKGTCQNQTTIKRADLESQVLSGLQKHLLHPDLFAEFTRSYLEELNRLSGTIKKDLAKAERELSKVKKQIANMLEAISEGMFHESMNDKLTDLESRKSQLEAEILASPQESPVLLHPGLSEKYRSQVSDLTQALDDEATKAEATSVILCLLSEIALI